MTTETEDKLEKKTKKKKREKNSKVISFDEETVPKHIAEEILKNEKASHEESPILGSKKSSKKHKKNKITSENNVEEDFSKLNVHNSSEDHPKKKNKKRKQKVVDVESETVVNDKSKKRKKVIEEIPEGETNNTEKKKPESIRAKKREKYAKLLEEKKLKTELAIQEKSLNYLSKWKHSRNEWKFEKLKQIWLQHNMYDDVKVPDEFWETLVEYISNSKGKAREVILKDALKIVDEDTEDSGNKKKVERARDIIQNLQE